MKEEFILCAAIHNPEEKDVAGNPLIYAGHRHHNILHQSELISRRLSHQGFLTSFGRFVDRKEAFLIASENNQIVNNFNEKINELFSEHLY